MTNPPDKPPRSEIILYQTEDGHTRIQVRLQDETVWLTQADMAELFQTTPQNITLHLKNIYQERELAEEATCKDFLQVQTEGSRQIRRSRRFYNLDAIISVGYRIKSHVATRFRQWATQRLREYIIKGFTLDDERDVLRHAGKVSHEAAIEKAHAEYEKFRKWILEEPSPVERHFIEAIQEVKRLEKSKPRTTRKRKKGE